MVQAYEARVSAIDNIKLDTVEITLDGDKVDAEQDGDEFVFSVPEKASKQEIKVTAKDAAGNITDEDVQNIVVTTNVFVRLFNNTFVLVGVIAGVAAIGAGVTVLVFRKKKAIK